MNRDVFRYKLHFMTFVLLLGYTFIHTQLTGIYVDASFEKLVDFSVRFPFAQRLLVPALVKFLAYLFPVDYDCLFFLTEWLFISLLYLALVKLLEQEFKKRQAILLSWLFILLLPLCTVVNYRFREGGEATFFYPGDTASLFFIALGLLLCLRSQWIYLIPCIFLATLNRESSILLVLAIPALHWQRLRTVIMPIFFSSLAYLLARFLILYFLQNTPGSLMEFDYHGLTHFHYNLSWLLEKQQFLLISYCFLALPLAWFVFYDYIPLQYRPLRYVVLFYFLGLLMVGNFVEVRIFIEIIAMIYLPVCAALIHWANGFKPENNNNGSLGYWLNRYSVITLLLAVIVFWPLINQLLTNLIN